MPPTRDQPGPDSPGLRNGAGGGHSSRGERRLDRGGHYRLYGWFKPLAEVPIYLANNWRILNQLADDPIEHLGVLMEAPSDLADAVPLGYGQLTSPLDQIASVAGGRAGTNFNHIPDGTVSIR